MEAICKFKSYIGSSFGEVKVRTNLEGDVIFMIKVFLKRDTYIRGYDFGELQAHLIDTSDFDISSAFFSGTFQLGEYSLNELKQTLSRANIIVVGKPGTHQAEILKNKYLYGNDFYKKDVSYFEALPQDRKLKIGDHPEKYKRVYSREALSAAQKYSSLYEKAWRICANLKGSLDEKLIIGIDD